MNEIFFGLLAILLQGFFAGSETAFSRANWIRLNTWKRKRPAVSILKLRSVNTIQLLEQKEKILIATLILTNIFVVLASTVFSRFFIIQFGASYTTLAVVVVVMLSLIFGDFIPKIIAQAFPEYWTIISGPVIRFFLIIFSPFLPKGTRKEYYQLSRQDFLYLFRQKQTKQSIVINQIAKALFDFSQIKVAEIMIPKERIIGVSENAKFSEIKKVVEKFRFSRYPVWKDNGDEIIAVVHIKDMLQALEKRKVKISEMLRRPFYVQVADKAMSVLQTMTRCGEHLAVVKDNQKTVGIITLEDLLEEVVGEIRSET